MNLAGLTDSLATPHAPPDECPRCHSASRIGHGLCLGCLLRAGTEDDEKLDPEEFDAALAAVAFGDTNWRLGNYEILEEIGRGGMGVIYRARQRHSRRIVALKRVLSYHADSRETLSRFRREAEAAASLDHPNILPIYEVGASDDGVPFFSMKYAPGGSLQEVGPALRGDPREIVRLMAKVTRAVQSAHRQGILHRDLKPGNILLDGRGEPLVSDFGLAKWLDASSDITRTLTIFGTPGFIAPEQAEGRAADLKPAADVYSLGAILFTLLAGRPPFLGEHALAVIHQAADKPAPKLRSLVRGADRDLETICARCLERDPAARYHSAGDLADDFERWLEGRPIIARPVSPPTKLWRWSRRNPTLAAGAAAVSLLGTFAIYSSVQRGYLTQTIDEHKVAQRSVAITPLLDLDSVSADVSLPNSLAASLQTNFRRSGPARVTSTIPSTTTRLILAPREISTLAANLNVSTVLIGTSRRINDKRRIYLQLVHANSGQVVFRRRLDLEAANFSAKRLAELVAPDLFSALSGVQLPSLPARDPALRNRHAMEYIHAGQDFETRRSNKDFDRALECFQKAIDVEPASALARSYFAMTAIARIHTAGFSDELLAKAERLAREAVELDADLPEAHRALAGLSYYRGDLNSCRDRTIQAIELGGVQEGPALSLAKITDILGRPDLSLRWLEIAKSFQGRPADYESETGDAYAGLAEDEKAEVVYQRVLALHPDLPEGWMGVCRLRLLQAKFEEARQICRENLDSFRGFSFTSEIAAQIEFFSRNYAEAERMYKTLLEDNPTGGGDFFGAVTYESAFGRLLQLRGDDVTAKSVLERALTSESDRLRTAPQHPDVLYRLAAIESSLGKNEEAVKHLQMAFECGRLDYRSLDLDPRFDSVRDDPRYKKVFEAMSTRVASLRKAAATKINQPKRSNDNE